MLQSDCAFSLEFFNLREVGREPGIACCESCPLHLLFSKLGDLAIFDDIAAGFQLINFLVPAQCPAIL